MAHVITKLPLESGKGPSGTSFEFIMCIGNVNAKLVWDIRPISIGARPIELPDDLKRVPMFKAIIKDFPEIFELARLFLWTKHTPLVCSGWRI